jgi:hypothetical protein
MEEVNAYTPNDTEKETVIIAAKDFRLADALKHIEAGKIVRVIPSPGT